MEGKRRSPLEKVEKPVMEAMLNGDQKRTKKNFKNEVVKPLQNSESLMRLNRILSTKYALAIIGVLYLVVMFFLFNYLVNSVINIIPFIKDSSNAGKYFGIGNAFNFTQSGHFYLFLFFFVLVLDMMLIYKIRVSWKDNNVGQKGTERWAEPEELKKQYKAIPEKGESYPGRGGFPVARYDDKILVDTDTVNNLVIGITRSGKGEMIVFPMIDNLSRSEEKPSMVISDPKIELYPASKKTLENRGYKVYLLNLVEPVVSMGYNPLTPIIKAYKEGDYDNAELLARSLGYSIYCKANKDTGDNEFWDNNSAFAVQALILAHVDDCISADRKENKTRKDRILHEYYKTLPAKTRKKVMMIDEIKLLRKMKKEDGTEYTLKEIAEMLDRTPTTIKKYWNEPATDMTSVLAGYQETQENEKKITLYSIVHTFATLARQKISQDLTALDIYFNERPDLDRAKFAYTSIEAAGDRTKGSIISSALSKINIFVSGGIAKMTSESSIDLLDIGFGDKPIAVFLGIPFYESSNNFVASIFLQQTCYLLCKRATMSPGQKCKRAVRFILDEFGNIPAIEDMANYITAVLGLNMSFTLVIQSFGQLDEVYGKKAKTIRDNCANTMYIMTNDKDTAKELAETYGDETITNLTRNGKKMGVDKNFTELYDGKPLINKNQLMHLKKGENIVFRPMKREDLKGNDIETNPIFNRGKHRFKYRYQYLSEWFPSGLSVRDVISDTRENIDLENRIFDIKKYFADKSEARKNRLPLEKVEKPIPIINWLTKQNKKLSGDAAMKMKIGKVKNIIGTSFESDNEKKRLLKCLEVKKEESS